MSTKCQFDDCEHSAVNQQFQSCLYHVGHFAEIARQKPGKRMAGNGYIEVRAANSTRWIKEHKVIMEEHLGRSLAPHEFVLHRNGIRHDNRIENLMLCTKRLPANGLTVEELTLDAIAILEKYCPELLSPKGKEKYLTSLAEKKS